MNLVCRVALEHLEDVRTRRILKVEVAWGS